MIKNPMKQPIKWKVFVGFFRGSDVGPVVGEGNSGPPLLAINFGHEWKGLCTNPWGRTQSPCLLTTETLHWVPILQVPVFFMRL